MPMLGAAAVSDQGDFTDLLMSLILVFFTSDNEPLDSRPAMKFHNCTVNNTFHSSK